MRWKLHTLLVLTLSWWGLPHTEPPGHPEDVSKASGRWQLPKKKGVLSRSTELTTTTLMGQDILRLWLSRHSSGWRHTNLKSLTSAFIKSPCKDDFLLPLAVNYPGWWGKNEKSQKMKSFESALGTLRVISRFSHVFATPRAVACQAPLSMGFSRQEYWSGLLFPPPGDLPNPVIKPTSPALKAESLPLSHQDCKCIIKKNVKVQ